MVTDSRRSKYFISQLYSPIDSLLKSFILILTTLSLVSAVKLKRKSVCRDSLVRDTDFHDKVMLAMKIRAKYRLKSKGWNMPKTEERIKDILQSELYKKNENFWKLGFILLDVFLY